MLPEQQHRRPDLFTEAMRLQVEYLARVTGDDPGQLAAYVAEVYRQRYQPKRCVFNVTTSPGNEQIQEGDLYQLLQRYPDKVIAPAGTFYRSTEERPSFISQMVVDKLKDRKKVKKKQLEAQAVGDLLEANRCWYQQATIKINCNSLPGGFGSPFNIFYDKPGYNAITSPARCMIARAYTIAEQLLGGNFAWFSEEELINHILLNLQARPANAQIEQAMRRYQLQPISAMQLMDYYTETLQRYCPTCNLAQVHRLVGQLTELEVAYLFYYCNLRHVMWLNSERFRGYIRHVFDMKNVPIAAATAEDIWKLDETVLAVTTVGLANEFNHYSIQVITDEHPELIPKLVSYGRAIDRRLHQLDLLFDTFVNTDADIPEVKRKSATLRNTVIISDTDSEIFTAGEWDSWYRGGERYDITDESYQITALVIYWLHHSVRHACYRFSVLHGVSPEHRRVLAMKNEFLYPIMLLFDIKKTYAGVQTVQEGVILPQPKTDIKGQALRGSSICASSLEFIENFIANEVLHAAMVGKLSAQHLIELVLGWEHHIRDSIQAGSTEFLQITSLKSPKEYKNPASTPVVVAWEFWQEVYAQQYGDVQPPTKVAHTTIYPATPDYCKWLKQQNLKIYQKTLRFLDAHKRTPNSIIINPASSSIPAEIIPLVDYRKIVYHNCAPLYLVLQQLNINVPHWNKEAKTLFMDIYG